MCYYCADKRLPHTFYIHIYNTRVNFTPQHCAWPSMDPGMNFIKYFEVQLLPLSSRRYKSKDSYWYNFPHKLRDMAGVRALSNIGCGCDYVTAGDMWHWSPRGRIYGTRSILSRGHLSLITGYFRPPHQYHLYTLIMFQGTWIQMSGKKLKQRVKSTLFCSAASDTWKSSKQTFHTNYQQVSELYIVTGVTNDHPPSSGSGLRGEEKCVQCGSSELNWPETLGRRP